MTTQAVIMAIGTANIASAVAMGVAKVATLCIEWCYSNS